MTVNCASCGKPFEAKRRDARYCGSTCRMRALEARKAAVPTIPVESGILAAVRRDLEAAGRLDTPLGQVAVRLAERMIGSYDSGSGIASLSRELRTVLAEVLADAPRSDAMDELAERRRSRMA